MCALEPHFIHECHAYQSLVLWQKTVENLQNILLWFKNLLKTALCLCLYLSELSCVQFLTNIFFVPYLALREQPAGSRGTTADADPKAAKLPGYAPIIGITGAAIGLGSIVWALSIRPEYGGLAERWQYFVQQSVSNRVFFAFVLDAVLYYVWQALLMGEDATKAQRYIPFVGLISYLLQGGKTQKTLKGL